MVKGNNMHEKRISGFSKMPKEKKLEWVAKAFSEDPTAALELMRSFWVDDPVQQRIFDGFSENTLSNFIMPFGIAPNFMINGAYYAIPMVIEESSVVAAASSAAKFWMTRGGFTAEVLSTKKLGQVHFSWTGGHRVLDRHFPTLKEKMILEAAPLTQNMEKRGGGILDIQLLDLTHLEDDLYQIKASFETCDSMGANFINSVLESFAKTLQEYLLEHLRSEGEGTIIMAILSNFTPECIVRASVSCPVEELEGVCKGLDAKGFAEKFYKAVRVAQVDPYRATTHNKGIFNGIDAVVLATANDFRAIEACGHTYAARDGQYRSLSSCTIEDGVFRFWMDLPLAVGTVGGLTKLHPLAKLSLELLGNPNAHTLMGIIAVTGLAQNFAALRSLVTTGIQRGHMKMHLQNILNHLGATQEEMGEATTHFDGQVVSFTAVRDYLVQSRMNKGISAKS
jgi:hydroxymethylglutaryl-CoA reductase